MSKRIIQMTLACVMSARDELLLGRKVDKIGAGKLMMPGGKVEPHHTTLESCVVDEVLVETGLIVTDLQHRGVLEVAWQNRPDEELQIHLFDTNRYEGALRDSSELDQLAWHSIDALPYRRMMAADAHWLPYLLQGLDVWMRFTYNARGQVVAHHSIPPFPIPL